MKQGQIMPNTVLYHNPRCTKSRQALAYLQNIDLDVVVVEYLKTHLNIAEVQQIFTALPIEHAMQMIRPKEAEFVEAHLSKTSSDDDVLNAIVKYPKLLERPILLKGKKAAIGRPLEKIKALVNE